MWSPPFSQEFSEIEASATSAKNGNYGASAACSGFARGLQTTRSAERTRTTARPFNLSKRMKELMGNGAS
jgi:hypothetical protein